MKKTWRASALFEYFTVGAFQGPQVVADLLQQNLELGSDSGKRFQFLRYTRISIYLGAGILC